MKMLLIAVMLAVTATSANAFEFTQKCKMRDNTLFVVKGTICPLGTTPVY